MIKIISLNKNNGEFKTIEASDLSDYVNNIDIILWVDVQHPNRADYEFIEKTFNLHPLSIKAAQRPHPRRPKINVYPEYYFLGIFQVNNENSTLRFNPIRIFIGKNYLLTLHKVPINAFNTIETLWHAWSNRTQLGSSLLLYLIADALLDEYLPIVDQLSESLDKIEDRILSNSQTTIVKNLLKVKKELLVLRKIAAPLRDVFNILLRHDEPILNEGAYLYFQDLYQSSARISDAIDNTREMLNTIVDIYLSVINNQSNMIMKRLTAIATILMSLSIVTGIYGMNFTHMPELEWRYGYLVALGLLLGIGSGLYIFFKKLKWF